MIYNIRLIFIHIVAQSSFTCMIVYIVKSVYNMTQMQRPLPLYGHENQKTISYYYTNIIINV